MVCAADGRRDVRGLGVFDEEAHGACAQSIHHRLLRPVRVQRDAPGRTQLDRELRNRLDTVARHPSVHQDDIGFGCQAESDGGRTVARFTDHRHPRLSTEEVVKSATNERFVVGDDDAYRVHWSSVGRALSGYDRRATRTSSFLGDFISGVTPRSAPPTAPASLPSCLSSAPPRP